MADDGRAPDARGLHLAVQSRLRSHRSRLTPALQPAFDSLVARRGFLSADPAAFFHPLGQPIVLFPTWVAEAVAANGPADRARLLDLIEATVAGYLYVRVHDDRLDEALGDPDEALFLADSFLVRHQALLARHVGTSPRFWALFEEVAADYATAMLLERSLWSTAAVYGSSEFDQVLRRSHPLVLPGAAELDVADRWDLLDPLQRFVHHAVRAAQLVDDLLDCAVDRAAGRLTWVVRRLDGAAGPDAMARRLVTGGVEEIIGDVLDDIDVARDAADHAGLNAARAWLDDRHDHVLTLQKQIIRRLLLG